ncbi:MAG: hypothetical protein IT449_17415 [Phycisphaerales bacterium]|nr:hypothetical protein [Phycisphaerales bacterium]
MKELFAFAACTVACGGLLHPSQAEPPKGYREVRVTDDPGSFEYFPRINNRGQIVFTMRTPGDGDDRTDEIFLYDSGRLIRITEDHKKDAFPRINDEGTVVWCRAMGPDGEYGPTYEIMLRTADGQITRLTADDRDDYGAVINNLGHIAWSKEYGYGCSGMVVQSDIHFFDGRTEQRLTFDGDGQDGFSNQLGDLNDLDEIVWTKYNFCVIGWWDSDIMLYRDGRIRQLDPEYSFEPQTPSINNTSTVAWTNNFNSDGRSGIQLWKDGIVSDLTEWGDVPDVNESGEVAFTRWYDIEQTRQVWLYRTGRFIQMTSDQDFNYGPSMNDAGDLAFQSGRPFVTDIRMLLNGGSLNSSGQSVRVHRR